jgi:hypothetical protein
VRGVFSGLAHSIKSVGIPERRAGRSIEAAKKLHDARLILERNPGSAADEFYELACTLRLLSEVADAPESDRKSDPSRVTADKAMIVLRRAAEAGYSDHDRLRTDHELDSLRSRIDFSALIVGPGLPSLRVLVMSTRSGSSDNNSERIAKPLKVGKMCAPGVLRSGSEAYWKCMFSIRDEKRAIP